LLENRAATLKTAPFDSFAFEVSHLVPRPDSVLQPVEPTPGWMDDRQERYNRAESEGLTIDQVEEIEKMRSSQSVADADPIGHDLPAAIRLYTDGAVAYHLGDVTAASKNFQAVLDLPAAEGAPRSIWALYMLGRIAAQSDDDHLASEDFDQLRDRVLKGAPDPLGLAVSSIGDRAKPLFDRAVQRIAKGKLGEDSPDTRAFAQDMAKAVALYTRQAAYGSNMAIDSLLEVSQLLLATPNALAATIGDPGIQRVLVAYVMANTSETEDSDAAEPDPQLVAVLAAIEKRDSIMSPVPTGSLHWPIGWDGLIWPPPSRIRRRDRSPTGSRPSCRSRRVILRQQQRSMPVSSTPYRPNPTAAA